MEVQSNVLASPSHSKVQQRWASCSYQKRQPMVHLKHQTVYCCSSLLKTTFWAWVLLVRDVYVHVEYVYCSITSLRRVSYIRSITPLQQTHHFDDCPQWLCAWISALELYGTPKPKTLTDQLRLFCINSFVHALKYLNLIPTRNAVSWSIPTNNQTGQSAWDGTQTLTQSHQSRTL